MNQATTAGGNLPNPVLTIEGNPNPGNNRNRAQGRAFALGFAEAPQDPNVVREVGEGKLLGPEIVQETTDKIVQIKERFKVVRDRQKSYADNRLKPLEFSVDDKVLLKVSPRKGVSRSTCSNTANDTNPPNEITDEVARQLNTALPNLLTQLVQALEGNRVNQREATPSCSIKTFKALGAKEFFGTEGAVGLLTWFESIEAVLYITKCLAERQVEFASNFKKLLMEEYCPDDEVEKLESEFWNHKMVGSDIDEYTARFHELARLVPHMVTLESQRINRYIQGLAPEIKEHVTSSQPATIQGAVSMANRLTTDGIKDEIFKKKENAGNKKRSNDQNRNRGRDDRNKRQRTGSNFALTTPDQGQGQRQYAGQHPKYAKCNFHHSGNCHVCGRCKQVGHFT
nr:hypothetical protein [Tanacetum cinerariifolium]